MATISPLSFFWQLVVKPLALSKFYTKKEGFPPPFQQQARFFYFWLDLILFLFVSFLACTTVFILLLWEKRFSFSLFILFLLAVLGYLVFVAILRYIQFLLNSRLLQYALQKGGEKVSIAAAQSIELYIGGMDALLQYCFVPVLSGLFFLLRKLIDNWPFAGSLYYLYSSGMVVVGALFFVLFSTWYYLSIVRGLCIIKQLFPNIDSFLYWLSHASLRPLVAFAVIIVHLLVFILLEGLLELNVFFH